MIRLVAAAIAPLGLIPRGGFVPAPDDGVPAMRDGGAARAVVLIGNAGPEMWRAFAASKPDFAAEAPLDSWLEPQLRAVAAALGAEPVFPWDGPPYPPIQQWAARAEAVHASPLGIFIHPDFGLWHAYRCAFLFASPIDLPPPDDRPSPCDTCADKPCLSTCPVGAFTDAGYAAEECARHIETPAGADCLGQACRARRACPVGRDYLYEPDQAAFHMEKFRAAMARRRVGGDEV